jgi:hypothetical protein
MKKQKSPKVPVLEDALELNLPKLMRAAKAAGSGRLVLDDGDVRTVVLLSETRLAAFLGGRAWATDIVAVACLGGRLRPLLKCPRAHEGNFQSLYFTAGEVACRHCHQLRYRSNLAASAVDRERIARNALLQSMGGELGLSFTDRRRGIWRKTHVARIAKFGVLSAAHYAQIACYIRRFK